MRNTSLPLLLCAVSALFLCLPAAASDCRVSEILSGNGREGTLLRLDAGRRYGLVPGGRATVLRFDPGQGVPVPCAVLRIRESEETSAVAEIVTAMDRVDAHLLVRFEPIFGQARAHASAPQTAGGWRHEGEGSNGDRRTILSQYAWPARRGILYILDSVSVPTRVRKGAPIPARVTYTAAHPRAVGSLGAALTFQLRSPEGTVLRTLKGANWRIAGGGGIGAMEGSVPLPASLEPGSYVLRVRLGAPGSTPLVYSDHELEVAAATTTDPAR